MYAALPSFAEVVENVRNHHPDGLDQLYRVFRILSRGLRGKLGNQDFEDRLHDLFLIVVDAIRDGRLREAAALPSYIHSVAKLTLCVFLSRRSRHLRLTGSLQHWMQRRNPLNPEEQLLNSERTRLMNRSIEQLPPRDQEILLRFYMLEQPREQIEAEMGLTETQFRLFKSRAKRRLEKSAIRRPSVVGAR